MTIGYLPFTRTSHSVEAGWLAEGLRCAVEVVNVDPSLNVRRHDDLPGAAEVSRWVGRLRPGAWVVAEGIGGFLWAAVARAHGFDGAFTILPYVNPSTWYDVTALAVYRRFADPRDRVFVGSTPSARIYRRFGIAVRVAEPFGIDDEVFHPRALAVDTLGRLGIRPEARMLLYAGRLEPDKDLHRLLAVALKAQLLFPDLQIVCAAHVVDAAYLGTLARVFADPAKVLLVAEPSKEQLAALYSAASLFATASTSHFETFGRAPAEALACGTVAIAPRYAGFAEVLAQPGGKLVDVAMEDSVPRADEAAFLRAVYEGLAFARPPAAEIAAAARRRLCRSRTLRVLGYLRSDPAGMTAATVAADDATLPPSPEQAALRLPVGWASALKRIDALSPAGALAQLWDRPVHRRCADADPAFRAALRRSLCVPAAEPSATPWAHSAPTCADVSP